jgi:pyruvate formate lyase activating enzyme
MSEATAPASMEASSPFELRVNLGKDLPETTVREALATGDMGFLHSFTTGSFLDGPGARVVAWTTGCGWRCQYCHNPDTWTLRNGFPISVGKAAEELRKYTRGLSKMGGGLTISGGDPLMQDRFTAKLLAAAKEMKVHTCIETNGFFGEKLSDEELGTIDLVMLGLKAWNAELHTRLTGRPLEKTLLFARRLSAMKKPIWVRFVLVPGLTDDPEDIARIAEFAAALGIVERVEVLPFHQMGRAKWERLGAPYPLASTPEATASDTLRAAEIFRGKGVMAYA